MSLPATGDYIASIQTPQCILAQSLKGGSVKTRANGSPLFYSGGFAVVFPYEVKGKTYAFRCWTKELGGTQHRSQIISQYLNTQNIPYFVGFNYINHGIITPLGPQPIIQMDWVDGMTLKEYVASNLGKPDRLTSLAEDFKTMVETLHKHQIAHGDLQHENILVKADGSLFLVDYDSLFVPPLQGEKDIIKGLPAYQHPSRQDVDLANETLDYFSELVIYLSIKALAYRPAWWNERKIHEIDDLFFQPEEIQSRGTAPIFKTLTGVKNKHISKLAKELVHYCRADQFGVFQPLEHIIKKVSSRPWDNKKQVIHLLPLNLIER